MSKSVKRCIFVGRVLRCPLFESDALSSKGGDEIFMELPLRPIHTRDFAPGVCSRLIVCTCHEYTRGNVFKFAQFAQGACPQIFNR